MSDKIKVKVRRHSEKVGVKVHQQEVTLSLKGIYHNKIYHDETLEGEGRIDDKLRVAESVLKHIDDNTELGNRAINIANQATVIANNAENIANRANETSARAEENSLQALAVANSANQKSDSAVATANEASSVANTALSNSQQAISTADSASAKADEALSTSARAESKSDNAVATAGRAESSATQAVSTSNQALENSEQALASAQSAVDAAQRATEAAEAAEQAVQEYDGRIQQAQDDAASALSQVATKQDTLISGTNIKTLNNESLLGSGNIDITSAQWGNITGDLADQEDLKDELDTINDRIDNVEARGRFLALWNATTGLPESTPQITPYTYKTGDYYIVGAVGAINYKPSGTEFVEGQPSTEIETEELTTDDVYYYDGAVWRLQVNHGKTVSFANLAGQPEDNTALKNALDGKQPVGNYAEKDKVNVFTARQKIQSGAADGAIIMGADAAANTLTNGTRKVSRIAMPLHEDVTKTMLLFGGDTIGDAGSTIGQTSTGTPINRIEFGGRLGAEVAAPDGIAFTVARTHNATDKTQKVYALEMNKSQARFNVRPNYNGVNLATVNDLSTKQDKLTAGQNITIVDNVISATGGGAGAVDSVNGKTGTVVLTGEDISADVGELTDTVQGHLQTLHDNIKDIELFKFPNATIIGEPIIDHGQVSGFSESNYLQFPFIVDLHNQPFVIDFCFTTGNDVTTQQNILDSQFGLALAIANGRGLMAISHNGTSWAGAVTGTMAIQPNTTYYARLSWNRINYQTQLSTDGTTYTSDMNFGSTQSPYPRTMFIGGCSGSAIGHTPHPFGGSINMNYAYLTVDGQIVWQGMDDAGLATRMDIDAGNISDAGKERIKQIVDIDSKQNKLVAGENITIDESTNTISATGGGSGSGRNIGDIFYTTRTDTGLAGAVECNGGTYSTADYEGEGSIGELLAGGKLPYVSLAEYATLLSANGVVGFYGWDGTGTTTFRVPTLQDVFVECGQASQLGNYIPAGLPNITGVLNRVIMYNGTSGTGAFRVGASAGTTPGPNSGGPTQREITLDASRSSSIYGNSDTVQPKAIKYRAMVQLFNGATDEAVATVGTVVAQVGENTTQISDLRNMSNITATGKEAVVGWGAPDYSVVKETINDGNIRYADKTLHGVFASGSGGNNYVEVSKNSDMSNSLIITEIYITSTGSISFRIPCIIPTGYYYRRVRAGTLFTYNTQGA